MEKVCKAPFFTAEIFGNGDVYLCCPSYTKLDSVGNIFRQSWDEIWNSKDAVAFREKINNNDYSDCNANFCSPGFFPFCHEVAYINPEKLDLNNPKARIIKFSMDRSCNVACTICRHGIYCNEKARTEFLDSKIETVFLPLLKDAQIVNFTGTGDPFSSKHNRKFIKIITEKYPHIKFDFHTNGILCDKTNLEKLGVIDKLSTIQISLHSATKETYDKIVKFGNWEKLNNNLTFLSQLIKDKKLNELQLNFVVLSENYKAVPDFIELCKKYKAKAFLWQYRDIEGIYDYDSVNVCHPLHNEHKNFVTMMSKLDTSDKHLFMSPLLGKFTQIKNVDDYFLNASILTNQTAERYETKNGILEKRFIKLENEIVTLQKQLENNLICKNKKNYLILLEKVFSVKNEYSNNKKYKVVTIFGAKLKFKTQNK